MDRLDSTPTPRKGHRTTLAIAALTSAGAVALTPSVAAKADPPAPPPSTTAAPAPLDPNALPAPAADPLAPPAPLADPNAPPTDSNAPPTDPNAAPPEPGRVNNPVGGFSFVVPAGWTNTDATRLTYGSALLTKTPPQGAPAPPATDTSVLLGKLDLKLFAGAEPDNTKAAIRLASDMGEFFMPYPGTRINQQVVPLNAGGIPGAASYYEVKFTDTTKPNGQIWAAALGTITPRASINQPAQNNRWFVVWLGNANNPIDQGAAKALAESIRPYTPPPPPEAPPAPEGAPAAGAPAAPSGPAPVGVPVPVQNAPPEMMPTG
jgi:Fibronectin-attachment protein (FAP)